MSKTGRALSREDDAQSPVSLSGHIVFSYALETEGVRYLHLAAGVGGGVGGRGWGGKLGLLSRLKTGYAYVNADHLLSAISTRCSSYHYANSMQMLDKKFPFVSLSKTLFVRLHSSMFFPCPFEMELLK